MADIRSFFELKKPAISIIEEEEEDDVTTLFTTTPAVPERIPREKKARPPPNDNTSTRKNQERQLLLETLNQLKNDEAHWTEKLAKEADTGVAAPEAEAENLFKVGTRKRRAEEDSFRDLPHSSFSVRPEVGQEDPIFNMFHSLTLASPVSVRSSHEIHTYRFTGVSAVQREKTPMNLLKFACEIHVNANAYSVDSFSVVVTSPFNPQRELDSFLRKCEGDRDVSRALYGLSSYAELLIKRYSVYEAVLSKYEVSKDGTWPMGHTLAFPNISGTQLFISWKVTLDDHVLAEAVSDIQAYIRPSQSLLAHDKSDIFSKINNVFTSLIEEHGVLNAISTLHDIIYT